MVGLVFSNISVLSQSSGALAKNTKPGPPLKCMIEWFSGSSGGILMHTDCEALGQGCKTGFYSGTDLGFTVYSLCHLEQVI